MSKTGWLGLAGALALVVALAASGPAEELLAQDASAQDLPAPDSSAQNAPAADAGAPDQAAADAAAPDNSADQAPVQPQQAAAPATDPAQLAAMLAPVALYPDALLSDILTASTYPLEVVEADRWISQPGNAALTGEQLLAALQLKDWDPSVKSLVPFAPILKMMDNQLDWTEQLGNAFLVNQGQVMDAVQQLRRQAEAAGGLVSTPQQAVANNAGAVEIEPSNPEDVSIPAYNPGVVYGDWPYPAVPPVDLGAYGPDDFDGGYAADGWYFGPPVLLTTPIWFWCHFDWHHHRIDVDHHRFDRFSPSHSFGTGIAWQHDPAHRRGVVYANAGLQQRFQPERNIAAQHNVQVFGGSTAFGRPAGSGQPPVVYRGSVAPRGGEAIPAAPREPETARMPVWHRAPAQPLPAQPAPARAQTFPIMRPPVMTHPVGPTGFSQAPMMPRAGANFAAPAPRIAPQVHFAAPSTGGGHAFGPR